MDMDSQLQRLLDQIDDRQEELIELLKELISYKTPAPRLETPKKHKVLLLPF